MLTRAVSLIQARERAPRSKAEGCARGPESAIPALVHMTDCVSYMPPAPQCSMQIPYWGNNGTVFKPLQEHQAPKNGQAGIPGKFKNISGWNFGVQNDFENHSK